MPPRDEIHRVPLGASSASVYPGYSPADHIYGEAAQEYGQQVFEAKQKGVDFKLDPNGPEYVVGQSAKAKKDQLATVDERVRPGLAQNSDSSENGKKESTEGDKTMETGPEPVDGIEQPPPMFFFDSNPTPVGPNATATGHKNEKEKQANKKSKKRKENQAADVKEQGTDALEDHKSKKTKTSPTAEPVPTLTTEDAQKKDKKKEKKKKRAEDSGDEESANQSTEPQAKKLKTFHEPIIEEDDIEAEVESRLKEREEKRKRRKEKKRKRESQGSPILAATKPEEQALAEKPKKKKVRNLEADQSDMQKPEDDGQSNSKTKKGKKRASEEKTTDNVVEANERSKKKKMKRSTD